MTDCKHPRGEGNAFCPDCGKCLMPQHGLLALMRSVPGGVTPAQHDVLRAGYEVLYNQEWLAWVERKIAEEKK